MNRFSINLASRPFHNNTLYWAGLVACVVLLSAFTWYNVDLYASAEHDLERWNEALADHREAITGLDREVEAMRRDVEHLDLVALSERSSFANQIILSRLFSWTSLFDRLEEVMPPKVRLRSIRPSIGAEMIEITLDGMTPNPDALLEFEESLIKSDYFTFVYPLHESSRVKQGEINFSLTFGYVPDGTDRGAEEDPGAMAVPETEPETAPPPAAAQPAPEQASAGSGQEDAPAAGNEAPAGAEPPAAAPAQAPARPVAKAGKAPVVDLDAIGPAGGGEDEMDPNEEDPNDDEDPNDFVDEDEDDDDGGGATS